MTTQYFKMEKTGTISKIEEREALDLIETAPIPVERWGTVDTHTELLDDSDFSNPIMGRDGVTVWAAESRRPLPIDMAVTRLQEALWDMGCGDVALSANGDAVALLERCGLMQVARQAAGTLNFPNEQWAEYAAAREDLIAQVWDGVRAR